MALAYAGVDYQEVIYNFGAAEGSDDHWGTQKSKLGLAFPNLPWYIDDNVKLTQSNAILRYIGRKYNLSGRFYVKEESEIDMLIDTAADIQQLIIKIIFNADFVSTYTLLSYFFLNLGISVTNLSLFSLFILSNMKMKTFIIFRSELEAFLLKSI